MPAHARHHYAVHHVPPTASAPVTGSVRQAGLLRGLGMSATAARRVLTRTGDVLYLWYDRDRQRRALAELDGAALRDIGIGRAEAMTEAVKPFWRR